MRNYWKGIIEGTFQSQPNATTALQIFQFPNPEKLEKSLSRISSRYSEYELVLLFLEEKYIYLFAPKAKIGELSKELPNHLSGNGGDVWWNPSEDFFYFLNQPWEDKVFLFKLISEHSPKTNSGFFTFRKSNNANRTDR